MAQKRGISGIAMGHKGGGRGVKKDEIFESQTLTG